MYLAPVSGPLSLSLREEVPRAGLERPFGQPGRASEHARTAAPFTGATAQKKMTEVVSSGTSGASLAAGARAGAEVFEKPSGDGDDDDDGDDAQVGRVCPFVSRPSRRPSSALNRPTTRSARKRGGCGTGRGLCRLPPVRARARRAEARGARASLALAANTAGPSCCTAPGRLRRPSSTSSSLRGDWGRTLSRSPGLCEARRALW